MDSIFDIKNIIRFYKEKRYSIFSGFLNINLYGIRLKDSKKFNDKIGVFFEDNLENICHYQFNATVDPSVYYLQNPMNENGTLYLPCGQHKSIFKLGTHKDRYECLVQNRPIKVYRDDNKNSTIDQKIENEGWFGFQLHRANPQKVWEKINTYSAGCNVIQKPWEYDFLLNIIKRSMGLYGDSISYTLINKNDYYDFITS